MAYEQLKRNRYFDPETAYEYDSSERNYYEDLEDFHLPFARLQCGSLHDQHGIRGAGAAVFLVGVLHVQGPVAGHGAIAGRVVDESELRVAHVVVDRLGDAHDGALVAAGAYLLLDRVRSPLGPVPTDAEEDVDLMLLEEVHDVAGIPAAPRGPQHGATHVVDVIDEVGCLATE